MNQEQPRLMQTSASAEALKPDQLENEDITILKAITTRLPDGRETDKWAVRRADNSTCICWAAGQDPTLNVQVWFMEHPNRPLPCRIFRTTNKYGTKVWNIEQRFPDEAMSANGGNQGSIDAQLEQVGL